MQRVTVAEDFVGYPIVYADRVHDILTICLKADVKSLPPRGKLDLPGKLALALCNVSLALVPTALDIGFAYRAARTHVLNFLFPGPIFLTIRRVHQAAIVSHRKLR